MESDQTSGDGPAAQRPPQTRRTIIGGAPTMDEPAEVGHPQSVPSAPQVRSNFVPMLLLTLAFLGWSAFQTVVLLREADSLKQVTAGQQRPVQESTRLRSALDALARDMRKLAEAGNAGARLVVEELRKRGVTINPENAGSNSGSQ